LRRMSAILLVRRSHTVLIIILHAYLLVLENIFWLEVNCLTEDPCRREPKITVPEPEMTKDNKFKCPLDQAIYDNKKDMRSIVKKSTMCFENLQKCKPESYV
jgi:hypothetical protein